MYKEISQPDIKQKKSERKREKGTERKREREKLNVIFIF